MIEGRNKFGSPVLPSSNLKLHCKSFLSNIIAQFKVIEPLCHTHENNAEETSLIPVSATIKIGIHAPRI